MSYVALTAHDRSHTEFPRGGKGSVHASHCEAQRNSLHGVEGDKEQHIQPLSSQAGLRLYITLESVSCLEECIHLFSSEQLIRRLQVVLTFGTGGFMWQARLLMPSSRASTLR